MALRRRGPGCVPLPAPAATDESAAASGAELWGSAAWNYLHLAAAHCDEAATFRDLLSCVVRCLPCPRCRSHAEDFLRSHSLLVVTDRASAEDYVFGLHNHINALVGKAASGPEVLQRYRHANLPKIRSCCGV